jgi:hypothetical protein
LATLGGVFITSFVHAAMMLELAEALHSLVGKKFRAARAAKQLIFSPTEVTVIHTSSGLPVRKSNWTAQVHLAD